MHSSLPFSFLNLARTPYALLPLAEWREVYNRFWPHHRYHLSLTLAPQALGYTLNRTWRQRESVPEVLAFPLETGSAGMGDVVLVPAEVRRRAPQLGLSFRHALIYLFIHACLHLQGYRHGQAMSRREHTMLRDLNLPLPQG